MRIGLSSALTHETPEEWAENLQRLGCRSAVFPVDYTAPEHVIADYADAARRHDLIIAEVGIWKNVFAVDTREREEARKYALGQLKLADEIHAMCCVNIAGTYGGPIWDGAYATNFTKQSWNLIVDYTKELIDEVKPMRTKYSIESMPWMYPSGPGEYLKLIKEINRSAFGVHLDVVNMINTPQRYLGSDDFLQECFDLLGEQICSCHLKDIRLLNRYTLQLEETFCGNGTLNLEKYVTLIDEYNTDIPLIIEHLNTDEEYISSLNYVRTRLAKANLWH